MLPITANRASAIEEMQREAIIIDCYWLTNLTLIDKLLFLTANDSRLATVIRRGIHCLLCSGGGHLGPVGLRWRDTQMIIYCW